jgi:cytochrome c oxidase assembly protein subunit 19
MSTPQFRAGNPLAPEKGAFPLDHFGECTSFKEKYLECLRREKADSNRCKLESKMYLECRMAKELMAEQPLATLGFREEHDKDENNNNNDTENEKNAREEENEKNGFVAGARRARQQRREMEESRRSRR